MGPAADARHKALISSSGKIQCKLEDYRRPNPQRSSSYPRRVSQYADDVCEIQAEEGTSTDVKHNARSGGDWRCTVPDAERRSVTPDESIPRSTANRRGDTGVVAAQEMDTYTPPLNGMLSEVAVKRHSQQRQ
jgi:hypothetical protein